MQGLAAASVRKRVGGEEWKRGEHRSTVQYADQNKKLTAAARYAGHIQNFRPKFSASPKNKEGEVSLIIADVSRFGVQKLPFSII